MSSNGGEGMSNGGEGVSNGGEGVLYNDRETSTNTCT